MILNQPVVIRAPCDHGGGVNARSAVLFSFHTLPQLVWRYVRGAPGTVVWLTILWVTTSEMNGMSKHAVHRLLIHRSTNLHHLAHDPVQVLVSSAFWIDGGTWLSYFLIFNLFHVPAERWLGTVRWLAVVVIAHVGATYLSEGVLYWAIESGQAPTKAFFALDVGVSYGLAGIVGVLAYRITRPWRYLYVVVVLLIYISLLIASGTFTDLGHLSSLLIGFACYPLTRSRPEPWRLRP